MTSQFLSMPQPIWPKMRFPRHFRSRHFHFRLFLGTFHSYCPFGLYRFHVVALAWPLHNRRCNWHLTFEPLSIAEHILSKWHSTGFHEDWHAANVLLLRPIYKWAAGVGDRAVIAVFVLSFAFFSDKHTNEQQVWVTVLSLQSLFLLEVSSSWFFVLCSWGHVGDGLSEGCLCWPFIVLLLVSFLFLLMKLTISLLYLIFCFFHKLFSRKLFGCGNTRFGSPLFTSFMLAGVLL